ncbi:NAD(P)H-dependent oxidoreductase [Reyranella sp.]|uniref:NAD(P)H-dependent oxidoreductase n=1 Tax=Reyranella sp. TaxID=1929291 RepID=UPI00378514B0
MMRNIVILNGHPDPASKGLCHALAEAYAEGARSSGHTVRRLDIAALQFGLLHSQSEFARSADSPAILAAQQTLLWANHLVVIFPLWLGDMPALLKAFFEQTLRPGFAFVDRPSGFPIGKLKGRSARIIVTMGMPAFLYRWYFLAHGLKTLERNILRFVGIAPVRSTVLGGIGQRSRESIARALDDVKALGRRAV